MLYFKYLKLLMKSTMQYRASFWMLFTGQFFLSFFSIMGMYLLFARFGSIAGWTFGQAALCFAVIQLSFGLSEFAARGFDVFSRMVAAGDFDRLLARPRGTLLQVFGSSFEPSRLGRLVECAFVLAYAIALGGTRWDAARIATLVTMILSGTAIFTGIFILGATLCFFTVQGLEVVNIFTDGGREIAQYPLTIYNKWIMRFFTFIIPFGCVNYLPLLFLTGRAGGNAALYMLTPLLGFLFLLPCLFAWELGVKRYCSTGS